MIRRTGFTVVEVIIVMAIMAILLAIGTVSFRSYQVSTRDKTREGDITTIQNYLESLYPRELRDSSNNIIKSAGSYPAHAVNGAGGSAMTHFSIKYFPNYQMLQRRVRCQERSLSPLVFCSMDHTRPH